MSMVFCNPEEMHFLSITYLLTGIAKTWDTEKAKEDILGKKKH